MAEPWSIGVVLEWRPTVRHFDMRMEWLKEADASHENTSFKVTDDEVGVQWDDGAFEVTISAGGGKGVAASEDASPVLALLEAAIKVVQPEHYRNLSGTLQYVVPLKGEYTDRIKSAGRNLLGDLAPELGLTDFAMLVDANTKQFTRQMEFGIVSAEEIPTRLNRELGQISSLGSRVPRRQWEKKKLPSVALFIDTNWRGRKLDPGSGADWLRPWWSELKKDADGAVEAIISRVQAE